MSTATIESEVEIPKPPLLARPIPFRYRMNDRGWINGWGGYYVEQHGPMTPLKEPSYV